MNLALHLEASLCGQCKQHRIIVSGKGSQFLLCQLGVSDPTWPKYPPQPVGACRRFQRVDAQKDQPVDSTRSSAADSSSSATVNRDEP